MIRRCRQESATRAKRVPSFRRFAKSMYPIARMLSEYRKHGSRSPAVAMLTVAALGCSLAGGCATTGDSLSSMDGSRAVAEGAPAGRDGRIATNYQALAPADPQPISPAVAIETIEAPAEESRTTVAIDGLKPMD